MFKNIWIIVFCLFSTVIYANDSAGTTAAGGIHFIHIPAIKMEKEHLTISKDNVRVDYVFKNLTDKPITLTIYFPLPSFQNLGANASWDDEVGSSKEAPFKNFSVTVNGQVRDYQTIIRAELYGQDITQKLKTENIPLSPLIVSGDIPMSQEELQKLKEWQASAKKLKLLDEKGNPLWKKQILYSWKETFPPKKAVKISHTYRPARGIFFEVGDDNDDTTTIRNLTLRMQHVFKVNLTDIVNNNVFQKWVLNRKKHARKQDIYAFFSNVNYILSTGSNWSGPIEDFILTLQCDKNSACFYNDFYPKNIDKKIIKGADYIEIQLSKFKPRKELQIIFVDEKV